MTERQRPQLERLHGGPSAGRAGIALVAVLTTLVVGGGASRLAGAGTNDAVYPGANASAPRWVDQPAVDADDGPLELTRFRVIAPEAGAERRNDGWIRVAARGAEPHQIVRAAVTAGASDLGIATMQADVRGVVEESIHLVPIASPSPARLVLSDAVRGHLLGDVAFTIRPGLPVTLMSPSRTFDAPVTDRLWVFGTTLPDVETVTLRVRRPDAVIVERTLLATGSHPRWRAFSTVLSLPRQQERQWLWLDVSWTGGPSEHASRSLGIPVRVSSRADQPLAKHPRAATPSPRRCAAAAPAARVYPALVNSPSACRRS